MSDKPTRPGAKADAEPTAAEPPAAEPNKAATEAKRREDAEDAVVLPAEPEKTALETAQPEKATPNPDPALDVDPAPDVDSAPRPEPGQNPDHDAHRETQQDTQQDRGSEHAAPPPARGPSLVPAGLVGAVAGAVVAWLVAGMGGGAGQADAVAALETRLAQTETALAEAQAALEGRIDAVAAGAAGPLETLGAADAAAAEDRAALGAALSETEAALRVDLADAFERIDALGAAERAEAASASDSVADLRRQVANLAMAVGAAPSAGVADADASAGGSSGDGLDGLARIALLEGAVERLQDRVSGLADTAAPRSEVARVDALEETTARLDGAGAEAAATLEDLGVRVGKLETEQRAFTDGGAALGVAFGVLSQAVAGSAPYAAPLATFEEVVVSRNPSASLEQIAGEPGAAALRGGAATGLVSVAALSARFDEASRAALAAATQSAEGDGGVAQDIARRLSSLVVVRRTTEAEGTDPAAVLSRAEARLAEGDAQAALAEIGALPEPARAAMGSWLDDLTRRVAAEAALDALRGALLPG